MLRYKRKRLAVNETSSIEDSDTDASASDVDISSALAGKRRKIAAQALDVSTEDGGEDELERLIKQTIVKRDIKNGTKLLKKTKGKAKNIRSEVGGGSFQSMGLHPSLLRSLTLRGYKIPTPIQRLAIPTLLSTTRDLVGMARTGSGKTLAYMIPLVQRLGGRHSTVFGARALILVPARELALQILRVGKDLVRGWNSGSGTHAGDGVELGDSSSQTLRWCLLVGGEGMDEQFEMITDNPDVIIATPGRLLHLVVEMNLDLRAIQYVVFDEADRLFELGFATALNEILSRLPSSRQTLLFSATLPKSLVEFAKAGLQEPKLVRLDAESKISQDLRMAFFSVKQIEKAACLLILLRDIIKVPFAPADPKEVEDDSEQPDAKAKASYPEMARHQTLVFAATKHHVEYLSTLLATAGYAISYIYGSLDQAARSRQMDRFRRGITNILVVTDVAARGIDIPVLENVINYDFPQGSRVFVHRVGRTARAGRKGWAWSFVSGTELPHLLDLQLFLGRPLQDTVRDGSGEQAYTEALVLGCLRRERIDEETEFIRSLDEENHSLPAVREVMKKGQKMYERSQGKASQESYKRAKEMIKSGRWGFSTLVAESGLHPVLNIFDGNVIPSADDSARNALLRAVDAFTPGETVFEIGARGQTAAATLMRDRRKSLVKARRRTSMIPTAVKMEHSVEGIAADTKDLANEHEIDSTFQCTSDNQAKDRKDFRDPEFYMCYSQQDALTEKGYSLRDGASFTEQARGAIFELAGDDAVQDQHRAKSQLKWDRKQKKFIKGDGAGADNMKIVKTESGTRLPATYRSGRFEEWKAKTHRGVPRVGEAEPKTAASRWGHSKRFKHHSTPVAKPLDKLSKDYDRKLRQQKKKTEDTSSAIGVRSHHSHKPSKTSSIRYGVKPVGKIKSELKSAEQIRKARHAEQRKKERNARPSRRKGGRR